MQLCSVVHGQVFPALLTVGASDNQSGTQQETDRTLKPFNQREFANALKAEIDNHQEVMSYQAEKPFPPSDLKDKRRGQNYWSLVKAGTTEKVCPPGTASVRPGTKLYRVSKPPREGLFKYRLDFAGGSLARLWDPNAAGLGSILSGQGIRSHMLQLVSLNDVSLKDPEGHS